MDGSAQWSPWVPDRCGWSFGERLVTRIAEIDTRFARAQAYLSSPLYRQIPHPIPFTLRSGVRQDRRALDHMIDMRSPVRVPSRPPAPGQTTVMCSMCSYIAAICPELWQHVRDEADSVLRGDPQADPESLTRLDVANRTVRETLRLHPASGNRNPPGGHRRHRRRLRARQGHARNVVAVSRRSRPRRVGTPDRLDPDRFLEPDDVPQVRVDDAWVPFGRGPRMCVGFALATMELVLVTARLAQRIDLTPIGRCVPEPAGTPPPPHGGGSLDVVGARSSDGHLDSTMCPVGRALGGGGVLMELTPRTAERFLTHAFDQLLAVAGRVPEPLVNTRPHGAGTNSVASLIVHCCGVTEYWLGHVALGEPTNRDREAEFSTTATLADLHDLVNTTIARAAPLLDRLDTQGGDGAGRPPLYGGDTSDAAIVLHVLEECYQHLGHAELAADALTARDGNR
jgi:hypothetical protein